MAQNACSQTFQNRVYKLTYVCSMCTWNMLCERRKYIKAFSFVVVTLTTETMLTIYISNSNSLSLINLNAVMVPSRN